MGKPTLFLTLLLTSTFAYAEGPTSDDPLAQTQALLKDQNQRQKVIQGDAKAKQADDNVKNLGLSSASQEELYGLSGDILETMVQNTGGDPEKLNAKVEQYMRDPSSLKKDLSPEQAKKIHELSEELPQAKPTLMNSGVKP